MKAPKCTPGIWWMLVDAIHQHRMVHHGLLPKRFQMHPENWNELRKDERLRYIILDPQKIEFMGVPIVVDARTDQLKMITAQNEVEYLSCHFANTLSTKSSSLTWYAASV